MEANGQAAALEQAANELEAALTEWQEEHLPLREAALESGYTEEHLRRLARRGTLPVERKRGRRSQMRIRRGDLPTKPRRDGRTKSDRVGYDPNEDARGIAKALGGTA